MEIRKIFDVSGVWLVNKAKFAFVDPTTGARFEPEVPTQAVQTEWVKGQPTISLWEDPSAKPKEVEAAVAKATATTKA